jgi:hypothetical protein
MEGLETETQPILIPMLEDKAVVLDAIQQHTLAKWATLRVLMGQHGLPSDMRAIPEASYHRFYDSRALPLGAQIWVGRYNGAGEWPTEYNHLELFLPQPERPEPSRPNGYMVACSVGYVALLYWGHELQDGQAIDSLGALTGYFAPIWPVSGPFVWPPPGLIGATGLEAALRSLPVDI